jgi:hypothetical protein
VNGVRVFISTEGLSIYHDWRIKQDKGLVVGLCGGWEQNGGSSILSLAYKHMDSAVACLKDL